MVHHNQKHPAVAGAVGLLARQISSQVIFPELVYLYQCFDHFVRNNLFENIFILPFDIYTIFDCLAVIKGHELGIDVNPA